MIYVKGRTNLSATIFVPWDCENNCSFCTSKKDYRDTSTFSLDEIYETILKIGCSNKFESWVITGGEPFANINSMYTSLCILEKFDKPVYINTTLPLNTAKEAIDMINDFPIIKGINISRTIGIEYDEIAGLRLIEKIKKPIRINMVLKNEKDYAYLMNIKNFIDYFGRKKRDINLRADFRSGDINEIQSIDEFQKWLMTEYDYISNERCNTCNTVYFSVDNDFIVCYHRGCYFTSYDVGNKHYVGDIIIRQDGKLYSEWYFDREDKQCMEWLTEKEE